MPGPDMPKIDDVSYDRGFASFNSGASLRSMVDQAIERGGQNDLEDVKLMSMGLGFLDALLLHLRHPLVAADAHDLGKVS